MPYCTRLLPAAFGALCVLGGVGEVHADPLQTCDTASGVVALTARADELPDTGVVILEVQRAADPFLELEAILPLVAIDAVDGAGSPVPGVVEAAFGRIVWRPQGLISRLDTVTASVVVDNGTIAELEGRPECRLDDLGVVLSFLVTGHDLSALPTVGASVVIEPFEEPNLGVGLERLVCCDSAVPTWGIDECTGEGAGQWEVGHCESMSGRRRLGIEASITWEPEADPTEIANLLPLLSYGAEFVTSGTWSDGTASATADVADCATVSLYDFSTSELSALASDCIDPEDAGFLGPVIADPAFALMLHCERPPYTCEVVGDAWDPTACRPWPDEPSDPDADAGDDSGDDSGDDDDWDEDDWEEDDFSGSGGSGCSNDEHDHSDDEASGCAYCSQGSRGPPWLWLLLLLSTGRRRRAREGRPCLQQ